MSTVKEMFDRAEKYNHVFKAKTYANAVEEFYATYSNIFKELNDRIEDAAKYVEVKYCEKNNRVELDEVKSLIRKTSGKKEIDNEEEREPLSEEMQKIVTKVAKEFIAELAEVSKYKGKLPKGRKLIDLNMYVVMYVLPGIIATGREFSYYLAFEIGQRWDETFGGSKLGCADYDTINSGFKRKLCYITTAVCTSLGKDDDCEELNMLREFRDGYMKTVSGGKELIEEYYEIAPAIVQRIKLLPEAGKVYKNLYEQYISRCIEMIKRDELDECLQCYKEMVEELR